MSVYLKQNCYGTEEVRAQQARTWLYGTPPTPNTSNDLHGSCYHLYHAYHTTTIACTSEFFWLWSLDLFWDSIWNNLGLDFGSIFGQVGTTIIVVSVSVRGFAAHAAVAADAAHASALSLRLGTVAGMASGWITKKIATYRDLGAT